MLHKNRLRVWMTAWGVLCVLLGVFALENNALAGRRSKKRPTPPAPAPIEEKLPPGEVTGIPLCLDLTQKPLDVANEQVLIWKNTTPNQYVARARVRGPVSRLFPDRNGHVHFEIQIGQKPQDVLEVVYNNAFGALGGVEVGMDVEACGQYITSNQPTSQYPASPSGAIIHWVHINPKPKGEPSGYLALKGVLYGTHYSGRRSHEPFSFMGWNGWLSEQ